MWRSRNSSKGGRSRKFVNWNHRGTCSHFLFFYDRRRTLNIITFASISICGGGLFGRSSMLHPSSFIAQKNSFILSDRIRALVIESKGFFSVVVLNDDDDEKGAIDSFCVVNDLENLISISVKFGCHSFRFSFFFFLFIFF